MRAIVSVDMNWGIGCNGSLLVEIPGDLQRFKEMTMGWPVIMGRKTRDSIPGKKLKGRTNIILSTKNDDRYDIDEDTFYARTTKSVIDFVNDIDLYKEAFVIGGEQIYDQFLDYCQTIYVTKINYEFGGVDSYFPNLDDMSEFEQVVNEKNIEWQDWTCRHTNINYQYKYIEYKRVALPN